MNNKLLALPLIVAAVIGCSDDKKEIKTGVFIDSAVQGLHYNTASRSGLTSAKGEFQYEPGETVTFSLGGIELGSAPGADRITPFDLFGIAPPSTEADARAAMRAREVVDGFDRAANIIYFLVALDRDGNPDNGIDLVGWHETLADATLSFDVDASNFVYRNYGRLSARYEGMALWLPVERPLAHFYRTVGIVVPAQAVATLTVDEGDDGTIEERTFYQYNSRGQETERERDENGDGTIEERNVTTYDAAGNGLSYVYLRDNDGNGTFESRNEYTNSYGTDGRFLTDGFQQFANDLVTSRSTRTYTYSSRGQLVVVEFENDTNADGIADTRTREVTTYDERGYLATIQTESDVLADGTVNSVQRQTFVYDAQGYQVSGAYEIDAENDGVVNTRTVGTYRRDDQGRELTYTAETFNNLGVLTRREVRTTEYNARGDDIASSFESDSNADGVIDAKNSSQYTYDDAGRTMVGVFSFDSDGDGVANQQGTDTFARAPDGQVVTSIQTRDGNGDGVIDQRTTRTNTYDAVGRMTSTFTERDTNGDGVTDERRRTSVTFIEIADGIEYLAYSIIAD